MLVLKRRRGEVITIGLAYVRVLQISEDWVELGISAPAEYQIGRPRIPFESTMQEGPEHANETRT